MPAYDPWNDAAEAQPLASAFYGQIQIDTWPCVLVKGQGKVPFDSTQHSEDQRCTALEINVSPLAGSRANFTLARSIIAQSPEWYKFIWPSLKALGLKNPKDAVGKYCKLERVPNGKKYRSKRDSEERDEMVMKFLALYATEAECSAAYASDTGQKLGPSSLSDEPTLGFEDARANAAPADDPQRKMAISFLKAIAKQHDGEMDAIRRAVGSVSLITMHFVPDSDEYLAVVAEALIEKLATQYKGDMDKIKAAAKNIDVINLYFNPDCDGFRAIVAEALAA